MTAADPALIYYAPDPYGFDWGAAQVTRIASLPNGTVVLNVRGRGESYDSGVTVTVSPKGKSVRAFRGPEELK